MQCDRCYPAVHRTARTTRRASHIFIFLAVCCSGSLRSPGWVLKASPVGAALSSCAVQGATAPPTRALYCVQRAVLH